MQESFIKNSTINLLLSVVGSGSNQALLTALTATPYSLSSDFSSDFLQVVNEQNLKIQKSSSDLVPHTFSFLVLNYIYIYISAIFSFVWSSHMFFSQYKDLNQRHIKNQNLSRGPAESFMYFKSWPCMQSKISSKGSSRWKKITKTLQEVKVWKGRHSHPGSSQAMYIENKCDEKFHCDSLPILVCQECSE